MIAAACAGADPPPPRPRVYEPGTCAGYCEHARALGCVEGDPTPGGATCETVCANLEGSGVAHLNLGCRAAVTACDRLDRCED